MRRKNEEKQKEAEEKRRKMTIRRNIKDEK